MTFRLRQGQLCFAVAALICALGCGLALAAQDASTYPGSRSQKVAILREEREQNLKDASRLNSLAEELKLDIEKNEAGVLPVAAVRKTDEIEKLVRKIRARLRHY